MDHYDPDRFPFLSYVLHHSDPASHAPPSPAAQQTLLTRFSYLTDPQVMSTLVASLPTTIAQTLFVLRSLGPRPDPSAVSGARSKIAQIRQNSSLTPEEAAKETEMYTAVVRLEGVHEGYEKQLTDVEEELVRVYASAVDVLGGDKMNEEVVAVLKQAEDGVAVERVDLSGRQLKLLPEAFGKINGLVSLNLSHNDLKFIPDAISGLQQLEELDVSSNILQSLPDSIGLLLNLRTLNVSGNKLTALPESIAQCRSLVELDASFNNLTSLPTNMGYGLLNLERLSVQLNKICYLPVSICEMRSLRYLDAHMNEIHGIPHAIGMLTNLEILNLSSNFSDLTELPDTISDLANLRELDLSNNQIRALPDTFFRLEKLMKLNLDQNPLEIPPLEVANKGAEAVRELMRTKWAEMVAAEQQRSIDDANRQQNETTGWWSWGTSMVSNIVSGVNQTVGGHGGGAKKNPRDSYLDQQL